VSVFGGFGATEILVIALLVVLLFGSRRIPDIARGLGRGIRNFKEGVREPDKLDEGRTSEERDQNER
jgi:sec-independent protein translocase protein TatA